MDLWLLFFIMVGVLIPTIGKTIFKHEFTRAEWVVVIVGNTIICTVVYIGGAYMSLQDTEIWNGHVTHKHSEKVRCEHSYQCNCVSVSCGKDCTTRVCQTCYRHSYDVDWNVKTTAGDFTVDREDSQGLKQPKDWTNILVGEPVALPKSFTNYIKAAPDSLFNFKIEHEYELPDYPEVHDYIRINRVIDTISNSGLDVTMMNQMLSKELAILGPAKESNVVVVLTDKDEEYARALESHWLGGKKNDTVVVIGLNGQDVSWTKVFGFTKNSVSNISIQNNIKELKEFDSRKIVQIISKGIDEHFIRRSMEEFEYLKDHHEPPLWVILLGLFFSIIGTSLATYLLSNNSEREWR